MASLVRNVGEEIVDGRPLLAVVCIDPRVVVASGREFVRLNADNLGVRVPDGRAIEGHDGVGRAVERGQVDIDRCGIGGKLGEKAGGRLLGMSRVYGQRRHSTSHERGSAGNQGEDQGKRKRTRGPLLRAKLYHGTFTPRK